MGKIGELYEAIFVNAIKMHSLKVVQKKNNFAGFASIIDKLSIMLDNQYTQNGEFTIFRRIKMLNEHAFQAYFTRDAIISLLKGGRISDDPLVLIDIGDSAGSHLKYQKELLKDCCKNIRAISVNLDSTAVEKIRKGGRSGTMSCRGLYS